MAGAEEILALFDSYWFEHKIFTPIPEPNPLLKIHQQLEPKEEPPPKLLLTRSLSSNTLFLSPNLQTIRSGKEFGNGEFSVTKPEEIEAPNRVKEKEKGRKKGSKSLTELEFEELKGFMDLGFVFSEQDRDSSLVSVIPGLGMRKDEDGGGFSVSRPYLSEAWGILGKRSLKVGNPLKNWKIPVIDSEIDMKDHLKMWAHSVASAVR